MDIETMNTTLEGLKPLSLVATVFIATMLTFNKQARTIVWKVSIKMLALVSQTAATTGGGVANVAVAIIWTLLVGALSITPIFLLQ